MLDFVGTHRKEFRFDRRLRALLGGSRADVERQVRQDFPFLPAGCSFELDQVAREIVLRSIRDAIPSTWRERCEELRSLGDVRLGDVPREQRPRTRGRLRGRPQLDGDAPRGRSWRQPRQDRRRPRSSERSADCSTSTTTSGSRPTDASRERPSAVTRQPEPARPAPPPHARLVAHDARCIRELRRRRVAGLGPSAGSRGAGGGARVAP